MWSKRREINKSYSGGLWDSTVQVSLHSDQCNANSDASKMENVGDTFCKSDVHTIICFLHLEGAPGNDIHRRLCKVFREGNVMSKHAVYQWIQQFDAGRVRTKEVSRTSLLEGASPTFSISLTSLFALYWSECNETWTALSHKPPE